MKRAFARELLLLSGPLLLMAGVAFWLARRPKPVVPVMKKWRIKVELVRRAPSPLEVWRGSDTQFEIKSRVLTPKDERPSKQGSLWNDVRLVETDEKGREARVWDFNRRFYSFPSDDWKQIQRLFFGGTGGGNAEEHSIKHGFALRRLPHPTSHMELRVDSVWRPIMTQGMIMDTTPGEIARMRVLPDALSTSRRWVLRKAGERTPTPRVSTDPLFDIRSVEFRSIVNNSTGQPDARVIWHVFWRGARKKGRSLLFSPGSLGMYDEKGNSFGVDPFGLDNDGKRGRSFSVFHDYHFSDIRRQVKLFGSKTLYVRGWISINGYWPRKVNVRLPHWILQK